MPVTKIVAIVLLVSMMFDAGLQMRLQDWASIARSYGLLAGALVANFVVVPLVAVAVTRLFHLNDLVATGIVLMAIAPGVPFVILAGGRQKGGSHELAVLLAVILPAVATFTIPVTAQLVLPGPERYAVPPGNLLSLLLIQIVPLVLGAFVAWRFSALGARLSRIAKPLTTISLVVLVLLLVPLIAKSAATVFGSFGMIAMLVTVALSLAIGWLFGGPRRENRVTLAFGTALRNPAVASAIATAMFPGTLVTASVVAYFLVQAVVAALFGVVLGRVKR